MHEPTTGSVTSTDGTTIAFDRTGDGPPVILVHGAFTDRTHPTLRHVAAALAPWFTVVNYDRRGRGGSDDVPPYALEREIEDLAALVAMVGGSAMVFGGSSGAGLVLEAAARGLPITRLALWEPPYHVDGSAPDLPLDFAERLAALVEAGRRGDAVTLFLTVAAQAPAPVVAEMRTQPYWPDMEAIAHTLVYEAVVMGPGNAFPAQRFARLRLPTLVLTGAESPSWMVDAGKAVSASIPHAAHRVLDGQTHNVAPEALAPELLEFFAAY